MFINPSSDSQPSLEISNPTSDFNFHIKTPRLYIHHLDPSNDAHCDLTVDLLHSPSSIKYNPNGPSVVPEREAARAFLAGSVDRALRTGYGRYLVSLRTGGNEEQDEVFSERDLELIGVVTMQLNRHPAFPGPKIPDVGFNFLPKYHGKGLASEAATHLMEYFREEGGVKAFAGLTDDHNVEAKKALGRLGFREWGVRNVKGVLGGGNEEALSVWTIGVEDEGTLKGLGL